MSNVLPPTLKIDQAAEYLGVSVNTMRRRIKSGAIKSYKDGHLRRIRREALLEYVNRLEQQEAAQ